VTIPEFASNQSELFLQGEVMSARKGFVLLVALSALTLLIACGSNGNGVTNGTAPPSGNFTNSNLNGTYVFEVSGTDSTGASYTLGGTLTANGSGGNGTGTVTGGTLDINDINTSEFPDGPIAEATINSNSQYTIAVDGRGQITIGTNISGLGNLTFDLVLSSSSHGLITEFDTFGTGSGTIDAQTSGATPSGAYAFSFSGAASGGTTLASVGNFTLNGSSATGLEDYVEGGLVTVAEPQTLSATVTAATSSTPASFAIGFPGLGTGTLTFDVFPIDGTHLKFIETDSTASFSGDAYSQTSTAMPVGTLPFTMEGLLSSAPFAAGGFMVTDSSGDLTSASSEDVNLDGTVASVPSFSASYAAAGSGRYTLSNFATFTGGTAYAAYPSSGGLLLLEIDGTGLSVGAAYGPQTSTTFAAAEGYGLNLSGTNLSNGEEALEIDDIAEFTADSTGTTVTGVIDENYTEGSPIFGVALTGTYTAPDASGRGAIAATAANGSNSTINGGFDLTFYTLDGTTYPFVETDSGQVATGVFVEQSPSSNSSAKPRNLFVPKQIFRPSTKAFKPTTKRYAKQ
jgi:fibronectin-binding autotransporter adhesin